MQKSWMFKSILIVSVCFACILFASQIFGTDSSNTTLASESGYSTQAHHMPVVHAGNLDWAVLSLVVSGGLILLVRPRRRIVAAD